MYTLKEELKNYIDEVPEDKLLSIKPLLVMLADEFAYSVEKISFEELTPEEQDAVARGQDEFENGECVDFEEYLGARV